MKFAIVVNEGPGAHQASNSAYNFARAVLDCGHEIYRVFFYHDGVHNAARPTDPPQDERNITLHWSQLAKEYNLDLVACVTAAKRRGAAEQTGQDNIADGFRVSGLGQLIDAGIHADRLISFGD